MKTLSIVIAIIGSVSLTTGSMFHNQWLMYLCAICFAIVGYFFSLS